VEDTAAAAVAMAQAVATAEVATVGVVAVATVGETTVGEATVKLEAMVVRVCSFLITGQVAADTFIYQEEEATDHV